jgi:hypothetical protein
MLGNYFSAVDVPRLPPGGAEYRQAGSLGRPASSPRSLRYPAWHARLHDTAVSYPDERQAGRMTMRVINGLAAHGEQGNAATEASVREEARDLVARFPIYD